MASSGIMVRCLASTKKSLEIEAKGEVAREEPYSSSKSESQDDDSPESSSSDGSSTSSEGNAGPSSDQRHVSCIQGAQMSADGTCIFTSDYERNFSVYVIDQDILQESGTRSLKPYSRFRNSDPIWTFSANPSFNIQDPNSTHVLVGRRDQYISLHNAIWDVSHWYDQGNPESAKARPVDISAKLASYKLIDHKTERVMTPTSLVYHPDGIHFYAGEQNCIAVFDLNITDDPVSRILTIPSKRNKLKDGGRGFKGVITALSISPPSLFGNELLAAGSRTRYVGIYDSVNGTEITHFALPGTFLGKKVYNEFLAHLLGDGVSRLAWSPCGKYLYVAERKSDAILIYDARNFSMATGYCVGRNALTGQKLGFDIWTNADSTHGFESASQEIWAGGVDGKIRVWRDPHLQQGAVEPCEVIEVSDSPVSNTLVHSTGSLAIATTGRYEYGEEGRETRGMLRGGGHTPCFKEWGCLDILGLSGY